MRWTVLAALALAGCSAPDRKAQEAYDVADEALAEAQRANSRADELEGQLEELQNEIANEALERQAEDAELNSDIQNHAHY